MFFSFITFFLHTSQLQDSPIDWVVGWTFPRGNYPNCPENPVVKIGGSKVYETIQDSIETLLKRRPNDKLWFVTDRWTVSSNPWLKNINNLEIRMAERDFQEFDFPQHKDILDRISQSVSKGNQAIVFDVYRLLCTKIKFRKDSDDALLRVWVDADCLDFHMNMKGCSEDTDHFNDVVYQVQNCLNESESQPKRSTYRLTLSNDFLVHLLGNSEYHANLCEMFLSRLSQDILPKDVQNFEELSESQKNRFLETLSVSTFNHILGFYEELADVSATVSKPMPNFLAVQFYTGPDAYKDLGINSNEKPLHTCCCNVWLEGYTFAAQSESIVNGVNKILINKTSESDDDTCQKWKNWLENIVLYRIVKDIWNDTDLGNLRQKIYSNNPLLALSCKAELENAEENLAIIEKDFQDLRPDSLPPDRIFNLFSSIKYMLKVVGIDLEFSITDDRKLEIKQSQESVTSGSR